MQHQGQKKTVPHGILGIDTWAIPNWTPKESSFLASGISCLCSSTCPALTYVLRCPQGREQGPSPSVEPRTGLWTQCFQRKSANRHDLSSLNTCTYTHIPGEASCTATRERTKREAIRPDLSADPHASGPHGNRRWRKDGASNRNEMEV